MADLGPNGVCKSARDTHVYYRVRPSHGKRGLLRDSGLICEGGERWALVRLTRREDSSSRMRPSVKYQLVYLSIRRETWPQYTLFFVLVCFVKAFLFLLFCDFMVLAFLCG